MSAGTERQQAVDQELHSLNAIATVSLAGVRCLGQQEVVHSADARRRIPDASRDPTSQDRGQKHLRIVRHLMGALDDVKATLWQEYGCGHCKGP